MKPLQIVLATLAALFLSSCSLPPEKQIQGTYVCKATGDRMVFKPNGYYKYSLGGVNGVMRQGFYTYQPRTNSPLAPPVFEEFPTPPVPWNARGHGLELHCYSSFDSGIWKLPYFASSSKPILTLTIGSASWRRDPMYQEGAQRTYIRQD